MIGIPRDQDHVRDEDQYVIDLVRIGDGLIKTIDEFSEVLDLLLQSQIDLCPVEKENTIFLGRSIYIHERHHVKAFMNNRDEFLSRYKTAQEITAFDLQYYKDATKRFIDELEGSYLKSISM